MAKDVTLIYFSPTGGVEKYAVGLGKKLGSIKNDIEVSGEIGDVTEFGKNDFVIVAGPVFGGRIPPYMTEKLAIFSGSNTPTVTMAVYGNRDYEDALLELNDTCKERGFDVIASCAVVAEHSIVRMVARGRPDGKDFEEISQFAGKILHKLAAGDMSTPQVPGNRPYTKWNSTNFVPLITGDCKKCGICAEKCPTQAIDHEDTAAADVTKCILCGRCIAVCPEKARTLPNQIQAALNDKLISLRDVRKDNEFFI